MNGYEKWSQEKIARELGLNQSTVCRQIQGGVVQLRKELRMAGVAVSTGLLVLVLTQCPAEGAPATLVAKLGKIVLARDVIDGKRTFMKSAVVAFLVAGTAFVSGPRGPDTRTREEEAKIAAPAITVMEPVAQQSAAQAESNPKLTEAEVKPHLPEPAILACCDGLQEKGIAYYAADPTFVQKDLRVIPVKQEPESDVPKRDRKGGTRDERGGLTNHDHE